MIGVVLVNTERSQSGVSRLVVTWTADSAGVAEIDLRGELLGVILNRLVTIPSTASPPTALYDLVIEEIDTAIDILDGRGADRSAITIETVGLRHQLAGDVRYARPMSGGRLCFRVTGAGDGGAGTAVIYCLPLD